MSDQGARPNHTYWLTKAGEDYRAVQERRRDSGLGSYAAQERWLTSFLTDLQRHLDRPLRLLDFGCGFGRIAFLCDRIGGIDYFGFDFSRTMAQPLLNRPPAGYAADIEQRVRIGDDVMTLFRKGEFDVVLTVSVLLHNEEEQARSLITKLDRLRQQDGFLVVIETPPVVRNGLANLWHGGCWYHDYLGLMPDNLELTVDVDMHIDHAVYIGRPWREGSRFKVKSNGAVISYDSRADALVAHGRTVTLIEDVPADALEVARSFDQQELHTRETINGTELGTARSSTFEMTSPEPGPACSDRMKALSRCVLPWLQRKGGLADRVIVQVGLTTDALTQALLARSRHVHCFGSYSSMGGYDGTELCSVGYNNCTVHERSFADAQSSGLGKVDGVLLPSVLEHLTLDECICILRTGWSILRPGGWLCVVDTPNRLCVVDHHTSLLPFFSMLPPKVRIAYARRSLRPEFANAFTPSRNMKEGDECASLVRWGNGISYHEFELALGDDVHHHITASGFESEINELIGLTDEDVLIGQMLDRYAPQVHRAFSRRALYLVLQKPD